MWGDTAPTGDGPIVADLAKSTTMTATNQSSTLANQLAAFWPADMWHDVTVLVAVSGGADSVALARALVALRAPGIGRLVLAHYNHRLRGAESDGDQAFGEELGGGLGRGVS